MGWHVALATISAAPIGFLAGLLSFRAKQQWCPTCGATLTCPDPTYHVHNPKDRRFRHGPIGDAASTAARRSKDGHRPCRASTAPTGRRESLD